jgi:hypothetical protein
MGSVEKQYPCPDVDGEIVTACEVMVETRQQQLFDSGVAIAIGMIRIRVPIGA